MYPSIAGLTFHMSVSRGRAAPHKSGAASFPVAPTGGALALRTFLDGKPCFCALFLQVGQWVSDHVNADVKNGCRIIKNHYHSILLKGNQGDRHTFTERPMFTWPANKAPLDGCVAISCTTSSIGAHTFPQPLLSISLLFTLYLQPSLTCFRAGRAGWLAGWLGAHGPRL